MAVDNELKPGGRPGRPGVPACVCVDAAGGDEPVPTVLEGVARALDADAALSVVLTGPAEEIVPFSETYAGRCEAHPTTQVIEMGEHPAEAVRAKRDSSIVVGCKLVRSGRAGGFFSAGSTGAVLAAATLGIGRVKGIDRPALTTAVPGPRPTVFLDLGANADCRPEHLVQFARMGCAYARVVLGVDSPRVGLLNIGSEETKGSLGAQACFAALRGSVPEFVGNAEGNDLFKGTFDVIVSDGFTGNVALKVLEGTAKFIVGELKRGVMASLPRKLAGAVLKPVFSGVRDRLSGDTYGGAVLLGVNGVVAIGHGATSPEAVMNGTLCVADAIRGDLVGQIAAACRAAEDGPVGAGA